MHKAVATDVHSSESRVEMSSRLTPPPFIPFPLCVVFFVFLTQPFQVSAIEAYIILCI